MEICKGEYGNGKHPTITYETINCPLCDFLKEKEELDENHEKELSELQDEIHDLENQIENQEEKIEELRDELKKGEDQIERI